MDSYCSLFNYSLRIILVGPSRYIVFLSLYLWFRLYHFPDYKSNFWPSPWHPPYFVTFTIRRYIPTSNIPVNKLFFVVILHLIFWTRSFFVCHSYAGDWEWAIKYAIVFIPSGTPSKFSHSIFQIFSSHVSFSVILIVLNIYFCTPPLYNPLSHISLPYAPWQSHGIGTLK